MKYALLLIAAALSLAFILSAGSIYNALFLGVPDSMGNLDYFRQDIIDLGLSTPLALLTVVSGWVFAALFYYVINSVRFDRWWNWLIVLAVAGVLCGSLADNFLSHRLEAENPGVTPLYEPYIHALAAWSFFIAMVLYTVASFGIRWWSSNCRHTPIPQ